MSDGVVSTKFVASSADAERAIAELEKKYEKLANQISESNSKAKSEAIAARQALKDQERQAAESAKKQRDLERAMAQEQKEERRRKERDQAQARRKTERDEADSRRAQQRAESEAARQSRAEARESARNKAAVEREEERETKRLESEKRREAKATARTRLQIAKEEAREKKRILREQERDAQQAEQASQRQAESTAQWVQGIIQAGTAYLGVSAILDTMIGQNQKLIEQADQQGLQQDMMQRKFRVQAELTKLKGEDAQKNINRIAIKNATTSEFAHSGAEALSGSGFSAKEASGEALDILLQGQAASNMIGEDPAQLAEAMAQYLQSLGQEINAKNLKKALVAAQQLSKPTNTKITDFLQLAGKNVGIAGVMSQEEGLAFYAMMRQVTDEAKASTAAKQFVERSTGSHSNKEQKKALAKMKIRDPKTGELRAMNPNDIDFVGEDINTVLDRYAEGFESLPKELRGAVTQDMFGTEAGSTATFAIRDRKKLSKLVGLQGNVAAFESDAATNLSGSAAARRRLDAQKDLQFAEKYNDASLILDQLEMNRRQQGRSELMTGLERKNADLIRYMGGSIEYAGSKLTPFGSEGEKQYIRALEQVQDAKGGELPSGIAGKYREMLEKRRPAKLLDGGQPGGEPGAFATDPETRMEAKKLTESLDTQNRLLEQNNKLLKTNNETKGPRRAKVVTADE